MLDQTKRVKIRQIASLYYKYFSKYHGQSTKESPIFANFGALFYIYLNRSKKNTLVAVGCLGGSTKDQPGKKMWQNDSS